MSAATKGQVFHYHRLLTKAQARFRRLAVTATAAAAVTVAVLLSEPLSVAVTTLFSWYLIYGAIEGLLPHEIYTSRRPVYDQKPGDPRPAYANEHRPLVLKVKNIAFSELSIMIMEGLVSLAAAFYFSVLAQLLPPLALLPVHFTVYCFSFYLLFVELLDYIGTMQMADFSTSKKDRLISAIHNAFTDYRGGYLIGMIGKVPIGLKRLSRYLHTLIFGPTGEGKSSSLIIPQMLMDADAPGSGVGPDAKSPELYNSVAGRWIKNGKRAILFDPWHPDTVGINFLPDADDQDLLTFVEVMTKEREEAISKEDPFFKARTRYILYAILKMVKTYKDEYCNLATVYYVVQSVEMLIHCVNTAPANIRALFTDFAMMRPETQVNAINSIKEKLDVFMSAEVRKAFSKSEFKIEDLFSGEKPCLLIIGSPVDKPEAGSKISSLIINLVINMAFRERRLWQQSQQRQQKQQRLQPRELYLYCDELRSLRINSLANLVSIARATRTHVIASVTDIGFLKYYREDYTSLMSNFRTRIAMRGLDYDSAKYISDSLGKEDINTYRLMRGLMLGQEQRNKLDPSEVMNLTEGKIIVFSPHTPPFPADTASIYKSPWLKSMVEVPPTNIRALYEEWGLAEGPLEDPILPVSDEGKIDTEAIKSGRDEDCNPDITQRTFMDQGGGKFRASDAAPHETPLFPTVSDDAREEQPQDANAKSREMEEYGGSAPVL